MIDEAKPNYQPIDIPFEYRHCCWFCQEPSSLVLAFPHSSQYDFCPHPALNIPACSECIRWASSPRFVDIMSCRSWVKQQLIKKYRQHLAIGLNWTKQELEDSGLEGKIFEGFRRSGWAMYEIAKARVNFVGWPLSIDYQELELNDFVLEFTFDGVTYPTIDDAIIHYSHQFGLDRVFIRQLLIVLGQDKFSRAISLARINIATSKREQLAVLHNLHQETDDSSVY